MIESQNVFWVALLKIQRAIMLITGIGTVLLVFVPLVLREVGKPFVAYEEFLLMVVFWMYMIGSSYGSYEKSQITADILGQFLKGKPKFIMNAISEILTFILGVIFAVWAFSLISWSLSTGATTSVYKIPMVIGQSSIFVSLVLSSIYNLAHIVNTVKQGRRIRLETSEKWEGV